MIARFPSPWWLAAFVALVLAVRASATPGATTIMAFTAALLGGGALVMRRLGGPSTLMSRPVDFVVVLGFTVFAVTAVLVDAVQAGVGPGFVTDDRIGAGFQPINLLVTSFKEWTKSCDPLLAANPLWYWTLAVLSPLLYLPFYVVAIYAFVFERAWIRDYCLVWGAMLSSTTVVIVVEEVWGQYPSPNVRQMLGGYVPWIVFPLFVMGRVWSTPVFPSTKER